MCNGYTHMLQVSVPNVLAIFRRMLQVFYLGVAYVSHLIMLQAFHSDVAYVSHVCQVFHLDIAYVLQWLHTCFSRVSDVCCKCFNYFGRML
jgi:hypothetical protein